MSQRIRDWFVEIPVAGHDKTFEAFAAQMAPFRPSVANWTDVFRSLLTRWMNSPKPVMDDSIEVKAFGYELLMRNLRWAEATHFLMDVILDCPDMSLSQKQACMRVLALMDATAGGYTIPSYRIPILWEHLFFQLRDCLWISGASCGAESGASCGAESGSAAGSAPESSAAAAPKKLVVQKR